MKEEKPYNRFKRFVNANTSGFDFGSKENEAFLENLVNYFAGHRSTYDIEKGLLIRGSIGVGKTSILKLMQMWMARGTKFAYNPANEVVSQYNISGDDGIAIFKKTKNRLFDDIGAEEIGKHFGNNIEVFQKIIYSRYDLFRYEGLKTHFTTNLSNQQLQDKYGERAYDRLKEMCNLVNWHQKESNRGVKEFTIIKEKPKPKEVTMTDKEKIRIEYTNQCILKPYTALKYGNNKFERNHTNHLFRFLFNTKLIEPTPEELKEYKSKAIAEMSMNAHEYTTNTKEKNLFKIELTRVKNGKESNEAGKVKQEAAHLYTVDWLTALANADGNLEEILKENGFYNIQND